MSSSFSFSGSTTFTITHARHLAAKVATDLKRIQRFYGAHHLSKQDIADFESEATELLRGGYLKSVIYGFQRHGQWIEPTLRYTAQELADNGLDDDPGRVAAGKDVAGAVFCSYLEHSSNWMILSSDQRARIDASHAVERSAGSESAVHNGYFADDKTYSSGGRTLGRASVRSYT